MAKHQTQSCLESHKDRFLGQSFSSFLLMVYLSSVRLFADDCVLCRNIFSPLDHQEQASLAFFHKVHSGIIERNKYLTLAPRLRQTRVSHELQYTRYLTYSDALKYTSPLPPTPPIPIWNALPASVASVDCVESMEEFKSLQTSEVCVLVLLLASNINDMIRLIERSSRIKINRGLVAHGP